MFTDSTILFPDFCVNRISCHRHLQQDKLVSNALRSCFLHILLPKWNFSNLFLICIPNEQRNSQRQKGSLPPGVAVVLAGTVTFDNNSTSSSSSSGCPFFHDFSKSSSNYSLMRVERNSLSFPTMEVRLASLRELGIFCWNCAPCHDVSGMELNSARKLHNLFPLYPGKQRKVLMWLCDSVFIVLPP